MIPNSRIPENVEQKPPERIREMQSRPAPAWEQGQDLSELLNQRLARVFLILSNPSRIWPSEVA